MRRDVDAFFTSGSDRVVLADMLKEKDLLGAFHVISEDDCRRIAQLQQDNAYVGASDTDNYLGKVFSFEQILHLAHDDPRSVVRVIRNSLGQVAGFCLGISKASSQSFSQTNSYYDAYTSHFDYFGKELNDVEWAMMQIFIVPESRGFENVRTLLCGTIAELLLHNNVLITTVNPHNRAMNLVIKRLGYELSTTAELIPGKQRNIYMAHLGHDGKPATYFPVKPD